MTFEDTYAAFWAAHAPIAFDSDRVQWDGAPLVLARALHDAGVEIAPADKPEPAELWAAAEKANALHNKGNLTAFNVYSIQYPVQFYALYLREARPAVATDIDQDGRMTIDTSRLEAALGRMISAAAEIERLLRLNASGPSKA